MGGAVRSWLRLVCAALFSGWLACTPMLAVAGWDSFGVVRMPNGGFQVTPSVRSLLKDAAFDAVAVAPRGANVGLTGDVAVGARSAAMRLGYGLTGSGVAALAARALPMVATGLAVYEVARLVRCYAAPGQTAFDGFLECDPGVPPVSQPGFAYYPSGLHDLCLRGSVADAAVCKAGTLSKVYCLGAYQPWYPLSYGAPRSDGSVDVQFTNSCGSTLWSTIGRESVTTVACPSGEQIGIDGKCSSGTRVSTSVQDVGTKLSTIPDGQWNSTAIVLDAIRSGGQAALDWLRQNAAVGLTGPASVNGPTSTYTPPGGSPQTTTTVYNITYQGDTFNYTTTTVDGSGGTTTQEPVPQEKIEVCGLPGKPACKIDETGTPNTGQFTQPKSELDNAADSVVTKIGDAAAPRVLPWMWGGIALPSGACSNITVDGPIAAIASQQIDLCGQPWVAWWRAVLAWLAAVWTAWHVYGVWTTTVGRE